MRVQLARGCLRCLVDFSLSILPCIISRSGLLEQDLELHLGVYSPRFCIFPPFAFNFSITFRHLSPLYPAKGDNPMFINVHVLICRSPSQEFFLFLASRLLGRGLAGLQVGVEGRG